MDPNLILAALVLFIKMDVHHPTTVKEIHIYLDIHTLGGNNVANGIVVNASQKPNGGDPIGDPKGGSKKDPKEVPRGDFCCKETFE